MIWENSQGGSEQINFIIIIIIFLFFLICLSRRSESSNYLCEFCQHNPEFEQLM